MQWFKCIWASEMSADSDVWLATLAFFIAFAATQRMRIFALKTGMVDQPSSRGSHFAPTPRGGGLAIVGAFLLAALGLYALRLIDLRMLLVFLLGSGTVAFIGYLDDRRPLTAKLRFCVHTAAAVIAVALIDDASLPSWLHLGGAGIWMARIFGVLAITWGTNLFNFMDGIDGIASAEAVFIGGAGAWLMYLFGVNDGLGEAMLCLAAASAGFLLWNWPPAKVFLGDVGSGFLGFTLAVLSWSATTHGAFRIEVWIILAGVFVVDATLTLMRRVLRGDRWFEPHRTHAYQHLARRWGSHLPVTMAVSIINIFWLLPWAWFAADRPRFADVALLVSLVPIIGLAVISGSGRREK
jgi:Fuc2NAc and GlcNAc transferase